MPFIIAAGAAVAAALGGGVVAVAVGAAVSGAITGAIIGAATSLISGGNILEGALRGAAIGGITAGVLSLGSSAFSALSQGKIGFSAAEQLTKMKELGGVAAATPDIAATTGAQTGAQVGTIANPFPEASMTTAQVAKAATVETAKKGLLSTPTGQMVAVGAVGGMAEGYMKGQAAKDVAEEAAEAEERRRRENVPGLLNRYKMRLKPAERWGGAG